MSKHTDSTEATEPFTVVKVGRKWEVRTLGLPVSSHKSKALAQAEADAENAEAAEQAADAAVAKTTTRKSRQGKAPMVVGGTEATALADDPADSTAAFVRMGDVVAQVSNDFIAEAAADGATSVPDLTPALIASMDRVARLNLAKAEVAALRAWKADGSDGDEPGTPIIDWMTDPANDTRKTSTAPKGPKASADPARDEAIKAIIVAERQAGQSWYQVALAIDAAGILTARGGKWYDTTASDTAKRLGVFDTAKVEAVTEAA